MFTSLLFSMLVKRIVFSSSSYQLSVILNGVQNRVVLKWTMRTYRNYFNTINTLPHIAEYRLILRLYQYSVHILFGWNIRSNNLSIFDQILNVWFSTTLTDTHMPCVSVCETCRWRRYTSSVLNVTDERFLNSLSCGYDKWWLYVNVCVVPWLSDWQLTANQYDIHDECMIYLHCVSKKTCHPLVTIISSNLNWFSKFIHSWKAC